MSTWCRFRLVILASCILTAACACSSAEDPGGPSGPAAGAGTTVVPSSEGRDPLQDELLADGAVTTSEMERALLAVVACVERAGFDADVAFDRFGYGFEVGAPTEAGADLADTALAACESSILSSVAPIFVRDNTPSEQEYAELDERIAACLEAAGIEDVEGLSSIEMSEMVAPNLFAECETSSR